MFYIYKIFPILPINLKGPRFLEWWENQCHPTNILTLSSSVTATIDHKQTIIDPTLTFSWDPMKMACYFASLYIFSKDKIIASICYFMNKYHKFDVFFTVFDRDRLSKFSCRSLVEQSV